MKQASGQLKSITVSAVITRADGTQENLGVISSWHRNPLVRAWRAIKRFF